MSLISAQFYAKLKEINYTENGNINESKKNIGIYVSHTCGVCCYIERLALKRKMLDLTN